MPKSGFALINRTPRKTSRFWRRRDSLAVAARGESRWAAAGIFDLAERYRKLSEVGDSLTRLKELVDFEVFRPALAAALKRSDGAKGGRPPYDAVLISRF